MKTAELNSSWFLCSGLFGQVEHFSSYVGECRPNERCTRTSEKQSAYEEFEFTGELYLGICATDQSHLRWSCIDVGVSQFPALSG